MRRICLAIVGLMLLAAPAAASDGKESAARAVTAAEALKEQAAQAAAAGKRLDFTSGPASEHLNRIFDSKAFAELPPVAESDMPWMLDWLGAVSTTNHTLMDFGSDPKRTTQEPDLAVITRNLRDYEDQITIAMAFQQGFFPRMLESGYEFLASLPEAERTPVRLNGLAGVMASYLDTIKGAICFASDSTTKPANARMIAAAVRDATDTWIELTEDDSRKQFIGLVTTALQGMKDKETAQHFRAIQAALEAVKS
jgi:hypothetical protein